MSTQVAIAKPLGLVKASIYKWLGVPVSFKDGAFWVEHYGTSSDSGVHVTVDRALQLSTVWACVRLLAETISTLPCGFFERVDGESRRTANRHNLYQLLHHQPNADMTAAQFWESMAAAMLLWGDAHAEKISAGNTIIALRFLQPDRVARRRLSNGAIETSFLEWGSSKRRVIPEADLFRIPAFSIDGLIGLSAVQYGANVFGSAMAADQAAAKMFANGMRPAGILRVDKVLNPAQREQLRSSLDAFTGSNNTGKTFVAEAGMSYDSIALPPEDAQLLETRGFAVEEICRWFRVPPFMVGHSEKSTSWGTGIEQQMIGFLTFSLRPWLTRIEQSIRRCLLTPAERQRYFAEFAIEGLMRADSAGRAAFYASAVQNGWMSRNEVRALENRPPADGGDVLTIQSNLIAMEKVNETTADASANLRSALHSFLTYDSASDE
jgi:HK97 family phage portal protein